MNIPKQKLIIAAVVVVILGAVVLSARGSGIPIIGQAKKSSKGTLETASGDSLSTGTAQNDSQQGGQTALSPGSWAATSEQYTSKGGGSGGSSGAPGSPSGSSGGGTQGKKKVCPEEWIDNRTQGANGKDQFFFIGGQRKELKDYDLAWITDNCAVTVQIVY